MPTDFRDLDDLVTDLKSYAADVQTLAEASLEEIGEAYAKAFATKMQQGVSPDGTPYVPLEEASKFPHKKYRNSANKPLIDTYDLVTSFAVLERKPSSIVVGTDIDYAEALHKGGIRSDPPDSRHPSDWAGTRELPPRPIVGFMPEVNRRAANAISSLAPGRANDLRDGIVDAFAEAARSLDDSLAEDTK